MHNEDINDDANFEPVILRKTGERRFEMKNVDDDIQLLDDCEWGGIKKGWSVYYKYPSDAFVHSYRLQHSEEGEGGWQNASFWVKGILL